MKEDHNRYNGRGAESWLESSYSQLEIAKNRKQVWGAI